jgi:transposase
MRSQGTPKELETRRRLAIKKLNEGWSPTQIANFLDVHKVTVSRWISSYRLNGLRSLKSKPVAGRPRFLSPSQEKQVLNFLKHSPTQYGFQTELWTSARLARLIEERFKISFHPNYLREWLAKRNYSPQKPIRRMRQRDQSFIDRWVDERWTELQKKAKKKGPTSF